jgi:hypothetical protein
VRAMVAVWAVGPPRDQSSVTEVQQGHIRMTLVAPDTQPALHQPVLVAVVDLRTLVT